ncbi:D-glycero-beta-D-manno-heptose-7-phosphate kinase [Sediminicoccus sp. KRV36]|uniref:D-glycero-beta-D-manno-heptose-7-phosphate kinase n=1 Tax=Sediminicoccus sp. KRV36 TaxID=3133721 RepID=UPI00200CD21A|nr:D-glycero-beta-D-manno-heptose-7-phosphate kinase [Sediminicoccus rosea]UPY39274.1 D-glycero-beta-D-manno-heptose-7-phosphate kinase [Sediminicoccus rosea]
MLDLSGRRIICLGDVMLDRFLYGEASRLSPEAPVPVVRLSRTQSMAGGAGNVARNILALGGMASLIGLVGEDAEANEIAALLGDAGHLLRSTARRTTVKLRVIAARQQVVRVDEEIRREADAMEAQAIATRLGALLEGADALILSDYGKGVLTPPVLAAAIEAALARGIPVLADPKGRDFSRYAGATCLTPNANELAEATGLPVGSDAECEAAARKVLASVAVGAVLATRSEKGMMLVRRDVPAITVPAMAREVFDVSGAGDTVIATLALGVAAGLSLEGAMRAANAAAGVVVGKLGTATCSAAELDHALREQEGATGEILSWPAAQRLVQSWHDQGLRVGFANGCFDILHAGHTRMLRAARAECDRLVVALNDDASVTRLKGAPRPVNPLEDRAAVIAALASVDAVIAFPQDTPLEAIQALRPDRLFKGSDYTLDQVVGAPEVASWGGRTVLLELLPGRSTSGILAKGR